MIYNLYKYQKLVLLTAHIVHKLIRGEQGEDCSKNQHAEFFVLHLHYWRVAPCCELED